MSTRSHTRTRTRRRTSVLRAAVLALVGALALSACDFDVYKLPLPGGTDVGDDPMTVTAEFRDVLDLVPQSTVKVDEVDVGRITDITLDGFTATVTMTLRDDVDLPANAVATIRQTSLLGEKFVSLAAPTDDASGDKLTDGTDIPLDRTGRNPEVEEVLGALSLVLNGGGIAQARTISRELNATLEGREDSVRSVLGNLDEFVGQLDDQKQTIVTAITKVNRLAVNIRRQQGSINNALEELPSALSSLNRQRDDLVEMLDALERLSDVGVRVIRRTKDSTTTALRQLQPVLTNLADSGDALVDSFNVLLTFPFVDEIVGRDPQVARDLRPGDYTNLSVQLDLNLDVACTALSTVLSTLEQADPTMTLPEILDMLEGIVDLPNLCDEVVDTLSPCITALAGLPGTAGQLESCADLPVGLIGAVCDGLPVLDSLPVLCDLPGGGQTEAPASPGPLTLGGDDVLDGLRAQVGGDDGGGGGLLGLGGNRQRGGSSDDTGMPGLGGLASGLASGMPGLLNRPAPGAGATSTTTTDKASTKPTLGSMMTVYDPALVSLLTPGMVLK